MEGDLGDIHSDEHGNLDPTTPFPEYFYDQVSASKLWLRVTEVLCLLQPGFQIEAVFLLVYYVLWEFILAGIIQGQIIDAFAEIRSRDDAMKEDSVSNCE